MSDQWMGSIAAQDQYRPLGNDPWTNTMRGTPVAPGQGFEPVQQSPVLYNTKAGPITEADIENTIGIGMGVSGGGLSVKDVVKKYPQMKIDVSEARSPNDYGVISRIETPKELRGQGLATKAMQDIVAEADRSSMKLALSPSGDWGASVPRLKDFYSRFGFIPNAGRNKDFATRETMIRSPVMGSLAETAPPPGIKAYHSSPHDFDKFDLAKIGTGEGAQVYGHGLYFAENPAVSGQGGQYWNQFMRRFEGTPEGHAAAKLKEAKFDREAALNDSKWNLDQIKDYVKHGNPQTYDEVQRWHHFNDKLLPLRQAEYDALASGKPVGPRTYEVNIKADPAHMLDWDAGLHRQSPKVRNALERFGFKSDKGLMKASDDALYEALTGDPNIKIPKALPDPSGAQIYESSKLVPGGYRDKVRATAALQEAGIPGIKYLDQGSRGAGTGSSNYVVFDPSIIDIMKKYGIAGAAPAGMGALAAQDQYNAQ